jgi:hypothetical protein
VFIFAFENFAKEFAVNFNVRNTMCIKFQSYFSGLQDMKNPVFELAGRQLEYVKNWPHLDHVLDERHANDMQNCMACATSNHRIV